MARSMYRGANQANKQSSVSQQPTTKPLDRGTFVQQVAGTSEYMQAFKKERTQIIDQYRRNRRQFMDDWRERREDLEKDLERRRKKVDRKEGVTRYRKSDPRLVRAQREAADKFSLIETKQRRTFRRGKARALRDLKKRRDVQIKQIRTRLRDPDPRRR